MVLYKNTSKVRPRVDRKRHVLQMAIEEKPERVKFLDRTTKERRKYIETCEKMIRSSSEYKDYIKYLKTHFDMSKCTIFQNISNSNGKKYSIEIHHEPFTLFQITDTVLQKKQDLGDSINHFMIADEVMDLHYRGVIGLIPLCKTTHELVTSDRIFIPLQSVYQRYDLFYDQYEPFMKDYVKDLIQLKVETSQKCDMIQSDVLDIDITYIDIDNFIFPEVPKEWDNALTIKNQYEEIKDPINPSKIDLEIVE